MRDSKQTTEQFALMMTRWVGSPGSVVLHTTLFAGSFLLAAFGVVQFERMLLVVTTLVSLEAIYLSIFIQMSLNYAKASIDAVEENIDEIQEDIDEIQKDVDEIQEDVDEIQEDVDEIQKDVDEIEEADEADEARKSAQKVALEEIRNGLAKLMQDIENVKGN
jgi:septal ring factor EnvC (AmiA/AmiB activator)